jgi:hypothetical protein
VFASCSGLVKRRVPVDVSKIVTNMVWHVRTDKDRKHMWLRQQIKGGLRRLLTPVHNGE